MAVNYRKTLISCYLGFITQAIAANFAPLLFLTFHNGYGIPFGKIALISSVFFVTQHIIHKSTASITKRLVASSVNISTAEYLATMYKVISVVRNMAIN